MNHYLTARPKREAGGRYQLDMAEHQVLFCPFCRESFEGQTACPEHELGLVSFVELPPDPAAIDEDLDPIEQGVRALPVDDRPLAPFDPRRGRGLVLAGAAANMMALGLPLLDDSQSYSLRQLTRMVPSLWTLLLVSITVLFVLARRRTPRRLRSLRVLVPLLSLLSPLTLGWAIVRLMGMSGMVDTHPGAAVYVVAGASLLLLVGGLSLGGPVSTRA